MLLPFFFAHGLPAILAIHQMINRSRMLPSHFARHAPTVTKPSNGSIRLTAPVTGPSVSRPPPPFGSPAAQPAKPFLQPASPFSFHQNISSPNAGATLHQDPDHVLPGSGSHSPLNGFLPWRAAASNTSDLCPSVFIYGGIGDSPTPPLPGRATAPPPSSGPWATQTQKCPESGQKALWSHPQAGL